jgi:two-component system catabolic regulation response regulator CreB/two-component system response regulator ChvI
MLKASRKRILVLDDNRDATSRIKTALEKQEDGRRRRYKVDTYNDPILVLRNFQVGLYVLFLIDFMMAKTSNHKVCNKIRQMDNKVKICYMSETYQNYEEARKVFPGLEIKCFIPKLTKPEDLLTKINEVLIR